MATLRDIARKAHVSTATVSNVLNDSLPVSKQLRARVLAAAAELDYRPNALAKGLRLARSCTVGMIVPDITNPFFPAVVRGAEDTLTAAGYMLIIGNSDNDCAKEESYYRMFLERQVDGLLSVAISDTPPATLTHLHQRGTPVVYVDRAHTGIAADYVGANNLEGSEDCVLHLARNGHQRIAIITGPLDLCNSRARLSGYRKALTAAGLTERKRYVREGDFGRASGLERTNELLALKSRPDAIFVSNALMACGALEAVEKARLRCPDDIALACFDRLDLFALLRPRLTCVAASPYELGAQGARRVLERISGKGKPAAQQLELPCELFIGESSRARAESQASQHPRGLRGSTSKFWTAGTHDTRKT